MHKPDAGRAGSQHVLLVDEPLHSVAVVIVVVMRQTTASMSAFPRSRLALDSVSAPSVASVMSSESAYAVIVAPLLVVVTLAQDVVPAGQLKRSTRPAPWLAPSMKNAVTRAVEVVFVAVAMLMLLGPWPPLKR